MKTIHVKEAPRAIQNVFLQNYTNKSRKTEVLTKENGSSLGKFYMTSRSNFIDHEPKGLRQAQNYFSSAIVQTNFPQAKNISRPQAKNMTFRPMQKLL